MPCQLCHNEDVPLDAAGLCEDCRTKLSAATTSATGLIGMTPTPAPSSRRDEATIPTPKSPAPKVIWSVDSSHACGLAWPMSVAVTAEKEVLVLDQPEGFRVLRFDRQGQYLGTLVEIDEGDAPGAISDPQGLCVGQNGQVLIPDAGNDRIAIWDRNGRFLGILGGPDSGDGQLAHPGDVDVDADGFVYVADTFNRRIVKFSPDGLVCLEVRSLGALGTLHEPVAITTDAAGNIYVIDLDHDRLVKLSPAGELLSSLPTPDGPQDLFDGPGDVRIGADGSVLVSDRGNLRIRRLAPSGELRDALDFDTDPEAPHEGGDFALLDGHVLLADRFNDRLVCVAPA